MAQGSSHFGSRVLFAVKSKVDLVFLFLPLSVTADHGQEPQMGVGEPHFRGGVADDSSRSSGRMCQPSQGRVQGRFPRLRESQVRMSRRWSPSQSVRPASRSPDEARADAVARVASLEAAIAALGDHDDQVRKSLEESLAKAKKSTNVGPIGVRLNSAMKFIECIRKRARLPRRKRVRLLQSQSVEEMASLVAAEARLESLRAEAAPTNVPAPPLVNMEAEFRRMQRVIDELQAELTRFKSKEIRATESDEEDRAILATDLPQSKKCRRTGPGMQPSLLAIGGVTADPSALMSTLIDQGGTSARESGCRNPARQQPEIRDMVSGQRERGRRRTQVLHTDGFQIGTGGKG